MFVYGIIELGNVSVWLVGVVLGMMIDIGSVCCVVICVCCVVCVLICGMMLSVSSVVVSVMVVSGMVSLWLWWGGGVLEVVLCVVGGMVVVMVVVLVVGGGVMGLIELFMMGLGLGELKDEKGWVFMFNVVLVCWVCVVCVGWLWCCDVG